MKYTKIKISVIIPVYNAQKYLKDSLNSVLKQTLKEIEVLCIDDNSPDNSKFIIKKMKKLDKRIKYYKLQKNSKAGIARNYGIKKAKGEFISFLDPDDLFSNNKSLETLYNNAIKYNVNAAGGNFLAFNSTKTIYDDNIYQKLLYFKTSKIYHLEDYKHSFYFWRFIYKRKTIKFNKFLFPYYFRRQDPVWFLNTMSKIKKFHITSKIIYSYRIQYKVTKLNEQIIKHILESYIDTINITIKNNLWTHFKMELYEFEQFFLKHINGPHRNLIFKYINKLRTYTHIKLYDTLNFSELLKSHEKNAYIQLLEKVSIKKTTKPITLYGFGPLGYSIYKKIKSYRNINQIIDNNLINNSLSTYISEENSKIIITSSDKINLNNLILVTVLNLKTQNKIKEDLQSKGIALSDIIIYSEER